MTQLAPTSMSKPKPAVAAPAVSTGRAPGSSLRAFTDLDNEHGFIPMRVEGALPPDLRGTLYRNGPARFSSFGRRYDHWFDGDGALAAVRFQNADAQGAARFVQSRGLVEERRQGRALYSGFGTRSPRGLLARVWTSQEKGLHRLIDAKNAANTSVMWDGERLLALWEGGRPTEISPECLATIGETDLEGVVVQTFSAHPHRVPSRRTTYNHGVRRGRTAALDIYAKTDGAPWRLEGTLPLPFATMMHDIAYTERYVIVFVAPIEMQILPVLLGWKSPSEAMRFRAELGTEVIVAPLDDLSNPIRFRSDARFFWHVANAFDGPDGPVIDTVLYEDFSSNVLLASIVSGHPKGELCGVLSRTRIDLAARRVRHEELCSLPAEFPIVAPSVAAQEHRYVHMAAHGSRAASGRDLHDRLIEVDVKTGAVRTWIAGDGLYPGEPIFVPREGGGERAGHILTLVYDANVHKSHVAVLDAERLEDGPMASVHFDHHVPFGFHGTFVPA